jgi:hypothetical protein
MNAGFVGHGAWVVAEESGEGRDRTSIDELLEELTELRELDQQRHAHAPGSPDHESLTRELELRTHRVMDRFRDWKAAWPLPLHPLATQMALARPGRTTTIGGTRTG